MYDFDDIEHWKQCYEKVKAAGHIKIVHAIIKAFFRPKNNKKRTVWIYGPANSGKSIFIRMLLLIFSVQTFDFRGAHLKM